MAYADAAPLSVKPLRHETLKTYAGDINGMCTTRADLINVDLPAFMRRIGFQLPRFPL